SEWYANGPLGLEQGFTVSRPPAGGEVGPLTLELSLSSSAPAVVAPGGKGFTVGQPGDGALAYTGLAAVDARGRLLPSHLRVAGGRLLLTVDAAGATYPLKVDPFVQQGAPLTGSGATGNSRLGASVALSANGNTALVGGNFDNSDVGAAWVFTRSGETWTQQGSKLTGSGEVGLGRFGSSVALSADGNTALIGGWADNTSVGAAWVFTRSGSSWSQQGPKLTGTGEVGAGRFGMGVSLSASGNTALIGGNHDNADEGAAWVFTREAETWSQQGSKLTPTGAGSSEASFGTSVALSGEGNTALIGAPTDNDVGSAWVFVLSEGAWSQQGGKLTGSGAEESALFGGSVAISGDGNTALVGGSGEASESGAAWVFARSGSVWSQQGERVTGSGETGAGLFGQDVALSSEGNTALIGGPSDNEGVGAAWVFQRSGEAWGQAGGKLTVAEGEPEIGSAVALSANATTALVGARFAHSGAGAAYVYASGSHAPTAITGTATNLTGSSAVLNGTVDPNGEEVTSCEIEWGFTMSYEHSVPCTPSPGSGEVNVAVSTPLSGLSETTYHFRVTATNESGTSSGKDETFKPEHGVLPTLKKLSVKKGPATGRTLVTITGAGFVAPVSVSFGGVEGIEAHLVSSTSITVATPPGTSGDAAVTVTTPNGTSAESPKFQFKYGLPTVTKVTPSKGAYAGGTVTTISGSGFAIGSSTELEFEKVPGTAVNCSSTSECTVTTPPASKKIKPATGGGANVIAVVGKSKSKKNPPADEFVYEAS
ncbi:MAG TPA: IPT/TIG domain-containing protein, partial [Solirubrobacteraceae bacterium]|nr:IPT/TIG domain-containing protein [Solirubrobacteraceae bacterium]